MKSKIRALLLSKMSVFVFCLSWVQNLLLIYNLKDQTMLLMPRWLMYTIYAVLLSMIILVYVVCNVERKRIEKTEPTCESLVYQSNGFRSEGKILYIRLAYKGLPNPGFIIPRLRCRINANSHIKRLYQNDFKILFADVKPNEDIIYIHAVYDIPESERQWLDHSGRMDVKIELSTNYATIPSDINDVRMDKNGLEYFDKVEFQDQSLVWK